MSIMHKLNYFLQGSHNILYMYHIHNNVTCYWSVHAVTCTTFCDEWDSSFPSPGHPSQNTSYTMGDFTQHLVVPFLGRRGSLTVHAWSPFWSPSNHWDVTRAEYCCDQSDLHSSIGKLHSSWNSEHAMHVYHSYLSTCMTTPFLCKVCSFWDYLSMHHISCCILSDHYWQFYGLGITMHTIPRHVHDITTHYQYLSIHTLPVFATTSIYINITSNKKYKDYEYEISTANSDSIIWVACT